MFNRMTCTVYEKEYALYYILMQVRRYVRSNFRNALIACSYFANSLTTYTDNRTLITTQPSVSLLF